jgi:uncharacterized protein (DUF302 family)
MSYYFNKTLKGRSFAQAIEEVTLKNKIDVDFKKYTILGACNPRFAHKALQSEDKIGVFLPCNVIVEEHENGDVEVSAVDPIVSMSSVDNGELGSLATEVQQKLKTVIDQLS